MIFVFLASNFLIALVNTFVQNVIDVTDPAGTTIYVMIENKSASTEQWRFVTTNWENYLHAFPVN